MIFENLIKKKLETCFSYLQSDLNEVFFFFVRHCSNTEFVFFRNENIIRWVKVDPFDFPIQILNILLFFHRTDFSHFSQNQHFAVRSLCRCDFQFSKLTKGSQFARFGKFWLTYTILKFPTWYYNTLLLLKVTQKCVQHRYPNSWLTRINESESMQPGNFFFSAHMIWQVCVSSQVMNPGFFTSPSHGKKTLEFGIKKISQHQKNFVSIVWQERFSALRFGTVEALFPDFQEGRNEARMNSKRYMAILEHFKKKIERMHPSLLSSGVILQHDTATPHRLKTTTAKITVFG